MRRAIRLHSLAAGTVAVLLLPVAGLAGEAVRRIPAAASPASVSVPVGTTAPVQVDVPRPQASPDKGELSIMVDRAKVIRLPERTQTVVVGNPAIADLSIQKNGVVVVTGKSYGVTNLIALDSGGNMLAESIVSVSAPSDKILTVQRGLERQSYSCTPACQPSVLLGDANTYFSENRGQADSRNQFATSR